MPCAVPTSSSGLTRDEKVENLVTNFSMIMMGMFEGVFAAMAAGLAGALEKTAAAVTEAIDGPGGESPRGKSYIKPIDTESEVNAKVKEVFSGLRTEVAEGFSDRDESFKRFIKNPAFDAGVRIVESHQLKLPRLTEPLSDSDLAGYVALVQNGDPELSRMMQELGEWQKTTPKFERRG